MRAKDVIIVPMTHWDREWYVSFNEYRAYLVLFMNKLITILKEDPNFKTFTLDGQVILLEDYLEVHPENRAILVKLVTKNRISIGPFYILPDEFLIGGEFLIKNLLLGHLIARRFGKVMKVGYIPDPFGHIAQLPQILSGFEISSAIFARGFGNEFQNNNLNIEFIWNAPKQASSVLAIHLLGGYFSASELDTSKKKGLYKNALRKLKRAISKFGKFSASQIILLNNGSDHLFAQPELPEIVNQWNEQNPKTRMEIGNFFDYIEQVQRLNPQLNSYEGELRGSKYMHILSGVLSTRIWIKQRNSKIENLYQRYVEPINTIIWCLDKHKKFKYPSTYIWTGIKWLLKNHPHDSISGCSIDQVHEEMKTRFDWSEQIGTEIINNAMVYLSDLIKHNSYNEKQFLLIVFNPLPWRRTDLTYFDIISYTPNQRKICPDRIKIFDPQGIEIETHQVLIEEQPRYQQEFNSTYRFSFIAEIPACGYKTYYVCPSGRLIQPNNNISNTTLNQAKIENEFYRVEVTKEGQLNITDKESSIKHKNIFQMEDVGDWGDEYDFSGPCGQRIDQKFTMKDAVDLEIEFMKDNPVRKSFKFCFKLFLPISLEHDRTKRSTTVVENKFCITVSLTRGIKRVDFKIEMENNSKDHRLRILFPSNIKSEKVYADGHFFILPRNIALPDDEGWVQKASSTNHQKDFVCIQEDKEAFIVYNKGLPEYEALKEEDGTVTLAITLLRSIGWLSRSDIASRPTHAGPDFSTPGAQCIGPHKSELALTILNDADEALDTRVHIIGKEFTNPLISITPDTVNTPLRLKNKIILSEKVIPQIFKNPHHTEIKPYLPASQGFFEIENKKVMFSALKVAEQGNSLIVRIYNLSSETETANLRFTGKIFLKNAKIVNLLEETPVNEIKAQVELIDKNTIRLKIAPHVIATIKIQIM